MSKPTEQQIVDTFATLCKKRKLNPRKSEGLLVPYFVSEFNRLMEHRELNNMVNTDFDALAEKGWYQNAVAARVNDMRKVDSGWHSTVFEMLVEVFAHPPTDLEQAYRQMIGEVKEFLVNSLDLKIDNLVITYFGGGEVLPSVNLESDEILKSYWLKTGIKEKNIIPIQGPKNYMLMAGEKERCGPTCEIIYNFSLPDGTTKSLEIGTVIFNSHRIRHNSASEKWSIEQAPTIVTGVAYGLGRLLCAIYQKNLTETPVMESSLKTIHPFVKNSPAAFPFTISDEIVLADQLKTVIFLLAFGIKTNSSPQGKIMNTIIRRARRKIAALNIVNWKEMPKEFEAAILSQYQNRYPEIRTVEGEILTLLERIEWPTGWNPDSYDPTKL